MLNVFRSAVCFCVMVVAAWLTAGCANAPEAIDAGIASPMGEKIAPYVARPGRSRPVVAIVGDNSDTELTDYLVPYGVLAQSGVADVVALSTQAGPIKTTTGMERPAFQIEAQATLAQFDAKFPAGADYVVVPATRDTPVLRAWIAQQANQGATIVSICNGALVVAKTGVMDGRRATAHWASQDDRLTTLGNIRWVKNARYVADGNWVSSAGVSAALPTAIALVQAIAGHDQAARFAQELAVDEWSSRHDSDAFQPKLGVNLLAFAQSVYTNNWFHRTERIGIPVAPGVDEAALALVVDAYSTTGRSQAFAVTPTMAPVRSRHGLVLIPDLAVDAADAHPDHMLSAANDTPPGKALDLALAGIAQRYGRTTAYGVALLMEYPGLRD